jgi:hypothetical protein
MNAAWNAHAKLKINILRYMTVSWKLGRQTAPAAEVRTFIIKAKNTFPITKIIRCIAAL